MASAAPECGRYFRTGLKYGWKPGEDTIGAMDILLADDEKAIAITLSDDLEQAGHKVTVASDGLAAKAQLDCRRFDVLITDIKMPGMTGMELLKEAKRAHPLMEVILITGYGTIESAVEAMKSGAFEYILKPFYNDEILHLLGRIAEMRRLHQENIQLKEELGRRHQLDNIYGRSTSMQEVFRLIKTVAPTDAGILIEGESGTGKELIAKAIHFNSGRKDRDFVPFSCAQMAPSLLEDALFGHEKGAFTGADEPRKGVFERAEGGTLFLDDVDDTPLPVQVKLLRAVQERQIERLGGEATVDVDVRVRGRVPGGPLLAPEGGPDRPASPEGSGGRRPPAHGPLHRALQPRPGVHHRGRDDGAHGALQLAGERAAAGKRHPGGDRDGGGGTGPEGGAPAPGSGASDETGDRHGRSHDPGGGEEARRGPGDPRGARAHERPQGAGGEDPRDQSEEPVGEDAGLRHRGVAR